MQPRLILLHGALGSSEQLEPLTKQLSTCFNVVTLTFFGHGYAPLPEGVCFGIEAFEQQLEEFLEIEATPSIVMGYSMGGYVALRLAIRRPELFHYILTLGTKLDWKPETAQKEAGYLRLDFLAEKQPAFLERLKELHKANWPGILTDTAQMMIALGSQNLLPQALMASLEVKATLAVGDRDKMVSIDETRLWALSAPEASLLVLPFTAHPIEKISQTTYELLLLLLNKA